jgi:hypothetical protein
MQQSTAAALGDGKGWARSEIGIMPPRTAAPRGAGRWMQWQEPRLAESVSRIGCPRMHVFLLAPQPASQIDQDARLWRVPPQLREVGAVLAELGEALARPAAWRLLLRVSELRIGQLC